MEFGCEAALQPVIERLIIKCLDENPEQRPRSARDILAWLPGRDAIEEAVAAGETPSPRSVAEWTIPATLSGRAAVLMFGSAALGLAAILGLTPVTMFYAQVPLDKSLLGRGLLPFVSRTPSLAVVAKPTRRYKRAL